MTVIDGVAVLAGIYLTIVADADVDIDVGRERRDRGDRPDAGGGPDGDRD